MSDDSKQMNAGDAYNLLMAALDVLRRRGAKGDAYLEQGKTLSLSVRDGKLEDISRAEVRGLAIRAMHEGRLGFAHTTALDKEGVSASAEKAVELAGAASQRDDLMIAPRGEHITGNDEGEALDIYDAAFEAKDIGEKEHWLQSAEATALGFDPRIRRSDGANYGEALSSIWIANSNGLFRHYRKSRANAGLSVIAEDGADKQAGEIDTNAAHWSDLPAPAEIGRRAGERAIRLIGGQPVETGRYPVVFSPEAGFALLIYVANALNGEFLSRKRSWLSDKFGAEIGSAAVTIRNDALRKGGLGSAPFDGEGINTRPITLVDAGHVSGRLLDLATALRLGATSTGSAQRGGYAALPAIGPSNLYLEPGTESADDLVAGVEKGLWVWGLNGWWIGLDPSNPQFSSAAFGLWIENGKPVRPVARVTIGGPLTEILGGIEAVGNDLVWDQPVKTPTFRTKPLLVSGT